MHELGYDAFTIPKLHASERRRFAEGRRVQAELRESQHEVAEEGNRRNADGELIGEARRQKMQQESRQRAIAEFAEKRDLR